jgi:nitroreductase
MSATLPATAAFDATLAVAPAAELRRVWSAMTTLRSAEPPTSYPVSSPDLAVALDILGEAVHRTGPSGARRVPSAGAIFPYDTLALCRVSIGGGSVDWALFRIEGDAGICALVPISQTWLRRLVFAMPGGPSFDGCYLIVMTRPWLSIRKYGPRGYLYTQLDAAHAAVNIMGVALSSRPAVLHAGLPAEAALALRNDFLPFHEAHSVIQLDGAPQRPDGPMVTVRQEKPSLRTEQAYDFEARAWASIVAPLHTPTEDAIRAEPRDATVLALPDDSPDPTLLAEWRALSAARRSAKRFAPEPLSGAQLAATIGALATPLPVVFGKSLSPTVSATVIVNDRLALSPVEYAAITRCARLVRFAAAANSTPSDVTSFVAACMGQAHIGHGQAFVLLHTESRSEVTGHDIRQALFRAGAGAQLLCLAATRDNIAASTIGGFDPAVWARIGQLPRDTELLYLLALGSSVPDYGPARADRAEKATAHGES